jgi:hypothetical protein
MKTPRKLLLAQHRAATPKLDAIRQSTVAAVCDRRSEGVFGVVLRSQTAATMLLQTFWHELILPTRRIWAGFATVWALIFIVNFAQRDNVNNVTGQPVHSSGPVMSLQAQQRWMNELFADRVLPPDADRHRNFTPKPRTQAASAATV